MTKTLLSILESIDNFHSTSLNQGFIPFYLSANHTSPQDIIGYITHDVYKNLWLWDSDKVLYRPPTEDTNRPFVSFREDLNTPSLRSDAIQKLALDMREADLYPDAIGGKKWRNERYTIYIHPFRNIGVEENVAFMLERSACELFGLVTYGVHMTMYLSDYRIWVPRRSRTKPTWPGILDNSVAGGIPHGMTPFESMVKECEEEASLAEHVSREHLKTTGAVSYFFQYVWSPRLMVYWIYKRGWRNLRGNLQPEVEYTYDMLCPSADDPAYKPKPLDGEVESFELMTWQEVIERMLAGEFKPNSALVLVDFLIRHGKVTPENEPNYLEIVTRMHSRFGFGG